MRTFKNSTIHWCLALSVAATQIFVAVVAIYASSQNRLSEAACLGGAFGSLGNIFVLAVVVIWAIVLAALSRKLTNWHKGLKPLSVVALSSIVAILIGRNAVLGCTV